jgi:hypothetical protein
MHHHNPTHRKHFPIVIALALAIVSIMMILGVYTKLSGHPAAVSLYQELNLLPFMKAFGIVEFIILVCLWWKPLRILGTLLASAYFGAGAVMMLSIGESALTATLILILVWIIHKCTWWSMWKHGWHCACSSCTKGHRVLPVEKR